MMLTTIDATPPAAAMTGMRLQHPTATTADDDHRNNAADLTPQRDDMGGTSDVGAGIILANQRQLAR